MAPDQETDMEEPVEANNELVSKSLALSATRSVSTGLLPAQAQLLEAMANSDVLDWHEAAKSLGLQAPRIRKWLREDPAFRQVYDGLFSESTQVAKRRIEAASEDAADELANLSIHAMKGVRVTTRCPECDHKFTINTHEPDNMARLKAIEMITKTGGILKEVRRTESETQHIELTFYQKVALEKIRRGLPVSEQLLHELEDLGVVKREARTNVIVDGEVKEVDDA